MCLSGVFSDYNMFLCRKYGVKVKNGIKDAVMHTHIIRGRTFVVFF